MDARNQDLKYHIKMLDVVDGKKSKEGKLVFICKRSRARRTAKSENVRGM